MDTGRCDEDEEDHDEEEAVQEEAWEEDEEERTWAGLAGAGTKKGVAGTAAAGVAEPSAVLLA